MTTTRYRDANDAKPDSHGNGGGSHGRIAQCGREPVQDHPGGDEKRQRNDEDRLLQEGCHPLDEAVVSGGARIVFSVETREGLNGLIKMQRSDRRRRG